MTGFVGLRSKSYAYKKLDGFVGKRCKGVKCCVVSCDLKYEDFKGCLIDGIIIYKKQRTFKSHGHDISMIETRKLALSRDDDKQIIKKDWISTLARGHRDLV